MYTSNDMICIDPLCYWATNYTILKITNTVAVDHNNSQPQKNFLLATSKGKNEY